MGADRVIELRFLWGANLYFPLPAARLVVAAEGLMSMDEDLAVEVADELHLDVSRVGEQGSGFRGYFVRRVLVAMARRIGELGGITRIAVRARTSGNTQEFIVAVPWKRGGKVEALAEGITACLRAIPSGSLLDALEDAGRRVAAARDGERPALIRPHVPLVAITGTNGKTTTSRMISHIGMTAGHSVAWSSTDGVFHDGRLVEAGDYSGPSGAQIVLAQEGIDLAVTETARGGILRRGIAVEHNDVSIITNISADHLGVDGIDTLDQLAEVKAVVASITRPNGWCVVNAEDPRTFAMRLDTRARTWAFSVEPDSPHLRWVREHGGRVTTVLDGWIAVLGSSDTPEPVVAVDDIPMTLAGLSRANIENALAATSGALALGYTVEQVRAGLTTFMPEQHSAGRMNIFSLGEFSLVLDMAHNEAGLNALVQICRGILPAGGRLLLAVGTAGDRPDDAFVTLGQLAGLAAQHVELAPCSTYLRGRSIESMAALVGAGVEHAGKSLAYVGTSEVDTLQHIVTMAQPGDVVGFMAHEHRQEMLRVIAEAGGTADTVETVRSKVAAAAP